MDKKLDEDCGCGATTDSIRSFTDSSASRYNPDPLVGLRVNLIDGRSGKVDDSIRNNTGEVIGYIIEGDKGTYRVFKNKIAGKIDESEGSMSSLSTTPGMGDVVPPGPGRTGSGDQFPSLSVGTPAAKKNKKKKQANPIDTSLMDFKTFLNKTKGNQ